MKVHYLCCYYSHWAHKNLAPRPNELWQSYKFCGAVKNGKMNGYLTVPFKKGPERIEENNAKRAREIFGRFLAETMRDHYPNEAMIPVPSKDSFSTAHFRSRVMLEEAKPDSMPNLIMPIVTFTAELLPASEGGDRGFDAVYPFLGVRDAVHPRSVVLIDDIVTTGGTLLATKKRFEEKGFEVRAALVCGRTVSTTEKAFFPRSFELAEDEGQIDL